MRLLITGSNGFLGGSVGWLAARNGYEILGIGRSNQPAAGWPGKYLQEDVAHSDLSMVVREFMPDVFLHAAGPARSEEHTSELQSLAYLVCRLLLEKKKTKLTIDDLTHTRLSSTLL